MTTPNIILVMADDLGYGDVAYNGNATVRTPHLDQMADEGLRFDRFYAAAPVCSPTRGSCLTGRHPYRYGIVWAGEYPLPQGEVTLAQVLKTAGYATGHFGKWHVGNLSRTLKQSEFPNELDNANYAPPWERGFDECFSTESMVPLYNPYYHVGGKYGTDDYRHVQTEPVACDQRTGGHRWSASYWTGPGQMVDDWLAGDDAEHIVTRALDFIERKTVDDTAFLALVWFHTPHTPVVAGDEDRAIYDELSVDGQHWFGCITAMDRQIGRLRSELERLGIADNTLLWFCSDNGPSYIHDWNSAGPLRGGKATLWEGGIRVPASLVWPARFPDHRVINAPVCTSDFYPTLLNIAGIEMPNQPPLDGIDVMPLLTGELDQRPTPICFQSVTRSGDSSLADSATRQYAVVDNRAKLASFDTGATWQLYDLDHDSGETTDIAAQRPDRVDALRGPFERWLAACARSAAGADYADQEAR